MPITTGRSPMRVFVEGAAGYAFANARVVFMVTPTFDDANDIDGVVLEMRGFGRYKRRAFSADEIANGHRDPALAGVAEAELLFEELREAKR